MQPVQPFPNFADALAWEAETREHAFLDLPLDLLGVEVVPLTLRRQRVLIAGGSPFYLGGCPGEGDVAAFLWALSPGYRSVDADARAAFVASLATGDALDDLPAAVRAVGDFIDGFYNDAPAGAGGPGAGGNGPETSSEASIIDTVASAYHWSEDAILDCRLDRLWQYVRKIAVSNNPKARFVSRRSARATGDWLRSLTRGAGAGIDTP